MVLMKVFNVSGRTIIYEVGVAQTGSLALVREHGIPRFVKIGSKWHVIDEGRTFLVDRPRAEVLETMVTEFAEPIAWGFQTWARSGDAKIWAWTLDEAGERREFASPEAACYACREHYPEADRRDVRVRALRYRSAETIGQLDVHVRAYGDVSHEDVDVEGIYTIALMHAQLPDEAAAAALDVFHAMVPVGVLDDFDISVSDAASGRLLTPADTSQASFGVLAGRRPLGQSRLFRVTGALPDGVVVQNGAFWADDEEPALVQAARAWGLTRAAFAFRIEGASL